VRFRKHRKCFGGDTDLYYRTACNIGFSVLNSIMIIVDTFSLKQTDSQDHHAVSEFRIEDIMIAEKKMKKVPAT
jgi:hypothetical protein